MVSWCSGYHVCFTRRRSRVRSSPEPVFPFFSFKKHISTETCEVNVMDVIFFVRFLIGWQASQTTTFEMHENAPLVCWMMLQLIGTMRVTQCGQMSTYAITSMPTTASAHSSRLAQSVEHETLNLGVVGSSPTLGVFLFIC